MAASSSQEGPSEAPPSLPEGWLAQWESTSKKYYFVQRATGHSQWDIPTEPALSVPTPEPTPQASDPFSKPSDTRGMGSGEGGEYQGADRGLVSDLAKHSGLLGGGKQNNNKPSGLGGLASSFLGGQGSQGHSSGGTGTSGVGGLAGQLIGGILGGGKPAKPSSGQTPGSSGMSTGHGTSGQHQQHQGGLMGLASGFMHPGGSSNQNSFGYSSNGQTSGSGGYSGQAPPASYKPPGQDSSNPYGPTTGQYKPPGQPQPSQSLQNQSFGAHDQRPPTNFGQGQQSYASPPQSQYGASNPSTPAYGQPGAPYGLQSQNSGYGQYPPQGQHQQYPPPPGPQQTPSYSTPGQHGNPSYPSPGQQTQYPPPPPGQPHTPSFPQQGQGGPYEMYQAPSQTHPGQQGQHGQQGPPPGSQGGYPGAGYPGQYGHGGTQGYGQQAPPQQGGYGQAGSPYNTYGAPPPAPSWRP